MKSCVFPGSFDPITCGHLNLIRRAAGVFDWVTVTVMVNRAKTGTIPAEERLRLIRKACAEIPNVEADLWNGLLADYMAGRPGSVVVRGIRNTQDAEQEITAAGINRQLNPGMETLLIPAEPGWQDVSSSAVREIASFGGDYGRFIPECIRGDVQRWLIPAKQE